MTNDEARKAFDENLGGMGTEQFHVFTNQGLDLSDLADIIQDSIGDREPGENVVGYHWQDRDDAIDRGYLHLAWMGDLGEILVVLAKIPSITIEPPDDGAARIKVTLGAP